MQVKICVKCKQKKNLTEFYKSKDGKDGHRTDCKKCVAFFRKELQKNNTNIDDSTPKKCRVCGLWKTAIDFNSNPRYKDNRDRRCKKCKNIYNAEHMKKNRRHYKKHLKRKYNITIDKYDELAKQQKYKCAICYQERKLYVDHDHKNGRVRELLCDDCNQAIGRFGENIQSLLNAVDYLNHHAGRVIQERSDP